MRLFRLFIVAGAVSGLFSAYCTKLDLGFDINARATAYQNANFSVASPQNTLFCPMESSLGFIIKDIRLSKNRQDDLTMEIGTVLSAVGVAGSTGTIPSPFSEIASRYPTHNLSPYFSQVYLKLSNFWPGFSLTTGMQSFRLASGLTLDDDDLGFFGAKLQAKELIGPVGGQVFLFQPEAPQTGSDSVGIFGASLDMPLEGVWQAYWYIEQYNKTAVFNTVPLSHYNKSFAGINYTLNYGFLTFEGEGALQTGTGTAADPANSNLTFSGNAFILKGRWDQYLGKYGTGSARAAFGLATGDDGKNTATNRAFYPDFGHQYQGVERSGYGDLYGCSLYNALGGLPAGASGMQMVNFGLSSPSWKGFLAEIDAFFFEADKSTVRGKVLGSEFDLRVLYYFADKAKLKISYAFFNPGNAYPNSIPIPSRLAFEASARF